MERRCLGRVFGDTLLDYLATGRVSVLHEVPEAAAIVAEGRRTIETDSAEDVHRTLLAHADASAAIGYLVERVDVTEFHKGGGSVRCMTNPMDITIGRDLAAVPGGRVTLPPV